MKVTRKGHLFQRVKDGNYYLQYDINGKRKIVGLGTTNLRDAQTQRDEILTPALLARNSEQVTRHIAEVRELLTDVKYPLDEVWKIYVKNPNRPQSGEGTLGNYGRCWNLFAKWLKDEHPEIERINQVSSKEAEAYAVHLWRKDKQPVKKDGTAPVLTAMQKKAIRGITACTFNYHIFALTLVFKTLLGSDKTPFSDIERKPEEKINRKNFSEEELKRILAGLDDKALDIPDKKEMKLLVYIGACTGLRLIDAVHLTWKQIDFANRMISLIPTKTKAIQRPVHIPLHPALKTQLDLASTVKDKGYVMPSMVARYKSNHDGIIDDFYKLLDLESVKLKEIVTANRGASRRVYSFHSLRHSFASYTANAGVPITTLAAILGDNVRTLEKYYIKASSESKTKAIMSLPSMTNETKIKIKLASNVVQALKVLKTAIAKDSSGTVKQAMIDLLQLPVKLIS